MRAPLKKIGLAAVMALTVAGTRANSGVRDEGNRRRAPRGFVVALS